MSTKRFRSALNAPYNAPTRGMRVDVDLTNGQTACYAGFATVASNKAGALPGGPDQRR
ncbi:hypothetical protein [Pararhizobium sp. DWP1-1-3]|uniref:hypothetical protein n=1 Tax=Pararhizobium sp. DWP1-1-3 TaxID=2804652 RepID=UPI003CF1F798